MSTEPLTEREERALRRLCDGAQSIDYAVLRHLAVKGLVTVEVSPTDAGRKLLGVDE